MKRIDVTDKMTIENKFERGPADHSYKGQIQVSPVAENPQSKRTTEAPVDLPSPPKKVYAKKSTIFFMAIIFLVGTAIILHAWNLWPFRTTVVTTENSYIRGQVTVLAPQVSGYIAEVSISDFRQVKKGDVLFRIDDRIYRQQLDQALASLAAAQADRANSDQTAAQNRAAIVSAEADIAQAEAELDRTNADFARNNELRSKGINSQRDFDEARAARRSAEAALQKAKAQLETARQTLRSTEVARASLDAKVAQAKASVDLARIDLSNTAILAPVDGQIGEAAARAGQYVTAGSQLTFIVPRKVWVIANMKETQTENVKIGQAVTFFIDALGGASFSGRVEEMSPATGSEFSVLKADNASGNFTKVVQRLPVRISIDPDQPMADRLRPGMSAITSIDTMQAP
jgi:multidrug resistance efflux pump